MQQLMGVIGRLVHESLGENDGRISERGCSLSSFSYLWRMFRDRTACTWCNIVDMAACKKIGSGLMRSPLDKMIAKIQQIGVNQG